MFACATVDKKSNIETKKLSPHYASLSLFSSPTEYLLLVLYSVLRTRRTLPLPTSLRYSTFSFTFYMVVLLFIEPKLSSFCLHSYKLRLKSKLIYPLHDFMERTRKIKKNTEPAHKRVKLFRGNSLELFVFTE